MPKIRSHRISTKDYDYEIALDLKDDAIMKNLVSFGVGARRRPVGGGEWIEVEVTLDFDLQHMTAHVSFEGHEIATIDLSHLDIVPDTLMEQAWEIIEHAWQGARLEDVIQAIPSDPVFGCLLKAGISSCVGQTVRCYYDGARGDRVAVEDEEHSTLPRTEPHGYDHDSYDTCMSVHGVGRTWVVMTRSLARSCELFGLP